MGIRKDESRRCESKIRFGVSREAKYRGFEDRRSGSGSAPQLGYRRYISRGNSCVYFLQNRKKRKRRIRRIEKFGTVLIRCLLRVLASQRWRVTGHGGARARDRANTRRPTRVARVTMSKGSKRSGRCLSQFVQTPRIPESHRDTLINTNTELHQVSQRFTQRFTETQRYVVPSSRRSLCTCLLPAWSYTTPSLAWRRSHTIETRTRHIQHTHYTHTYTLQPFYSARWLITSKHVACTFVVIIWRVAKKIISPTSRTELICHLLFSPIVEFFAIGREKERERKRARERE